MFLKILRVIFVFFLPILFLISGSLYMIITKESYFYQRETYLEHEKYIEKENYIDDKLKFVIEYSQHSYADKAFIWIHGLNDYYYHYHVGDELNKANFDVFAITLRRYGDYQDKDKFYVENLKEYYHEIDETIDFIKKLKNPDGTDKYKDIVLYGHSTGGLTASCYCIEKGTENISGLVLNSPFFDFFDKWYIEFIIKNIVYYIGKIAPRLVVRKATYDGNVNKDTIIERFHLENEKYHPGYISIYAGWISTIIDHHNIIKKNKKELNIPVLALYSSNSVMIDDDVHFDTHSRADSVLDVDEINEYVHNLGNETNLTKIPVKDAMHDVFVSYHDEPREESIKQLLFWLRDNF